MAESLQEDPLPIAEQLAYAPDPQGWMFKCDGCGKVAHANTPLRGHAIEDAQDAGWMLTVRHGLTIEFCPGCAIEQRKRMLNVAAPAQT